MTGDLLRCAAGRNTPVGVGTLPPYTNFAVLYCNFRSLAFFGLLGFLMRQLKVYFLLPS